MFWCDIAVIYWVSHWGLPSGVVAVRVLDNLLQQFQFEWDRLIVSSDKGLQFPGKENSGVRKTFNNV